MATIQLEKTREEVREEQTRCDPLESRLGFCDTRMFPSLVPAHVGWGAVGAAAAQKCASDSISGKAGCRIR